jgi:sulfopyruvate decarboxylase subunit beta
MRRYDAIKSIVEGVNEEHIIACNGMISRELFTIKDRPQNFYMLGSMGLAPAIGLGVSLVKPKTKIIVLAGDGNALMSLGTLATIGKCSPKNLLYVVLDNECHESTGGQETSSSVAKFKEIAFFSGIRNSETTDSANRLKKILCTFLQNEGPSFIHVKISKERVEVPRISLAPTEIKDRFMRSLAISLAGLSCGSFH